MTTVPIPAPVGGWNARDLFDQMPRTDAVRLVNLIPQPGYLQKRDGYESHATGLGGVVETLAPYRYTTTSKLIAAANGRLWDVTVNGPAVELASGFTEDRWQTAQFTDALILVNGSDAPQRFTGVAVSAMTLTAAGPDAITPEDFSGVNVFKGRAFYWSENEPAFWYAAAGSYQGAMNRFPLDRVTSGGGSLRMMITWTRDGGDGLDDFAVFVMTTGETLIYSGSDPGSANDWSLVGRFQMPEPIDVRGHARIGGDELIATENGWINLSQALLSIPPAADAHLGGKIVDAAALVATQYRELEGWEIQHHPSSGLVFVNIPVTAGQTYIQHVLNLKSGGWCEFEGINAATFVEYERATYFGATDGVVNKMQAASGDANQPIRFYFQPAFSYCGAPGVRKRLNTLQLLSNHVEATNWRMAGLSDLANASPAAAPTIERTGTPWGSPWGSPWARLAASDPYWIRKPATAHGTTISAVVTGSAFNQDVRVFGMRYEISTGGDA